MTSAHSNLLILGIVRTDFCAFGSVSPRFHSNEARIGVMTFGRLAISTALENGKILAHVLIVRIVFSFCLYCVTV